MKKVFISLMHKMEVEEYNEEEGRERVYQLVSDGYPIRASIADPEEKNIYITFGCKGAEQ